MTLAGNQLSVGWALATSYHAGFRGKKLATAVAIMTGESDRYTAATHLNDDGSTDRGLFQINSVHDGQISPDKALLALPNVAYAFTLSKGGDDFTPWAVFNGGRYLDFLHETKRVKHLGLWRLKVPIVERHFAKLGA